MIAIPTMRRGFEMINTVIFDMDGTVMNTLDDLTDAVNYVLGEFGMPFRKQDEYRRFFGNGIRLVLRW